MPVSAAICGPGRLSGRRPHAGHQRGHGWSLRLPTRAGAAGPDQGPLLPQATAVLVPACGPDTVASRRADGRGVPQGRGRRVGPCYPPQPATVSGCGQPDGCGGVQGVRGCWRSCDGVRSAGVRRGHCGQGMSAATGSGRLPGVRWCGAATAARPAGAAGKPLAELLAHMAGRSSARASSAVSPPSWRPGRSPRSQPPMTARAVACGSTPTLAQVSVGQARWSPPPAVPSKTASMSWLASTTRSGSSASPITSVRSRGPTPRRARRNQPAPPAGRACRWSRRWPRPPFCRGDAAKGARAASAGGPSSTGGARSCRDRPHPTAPLAPRESGSAHGHSDRTRGRLHREISQSLPVQPVVVSEPTRSCCMANSVAAARLETPAFA
jgi:hypothetical protein